MPSKPFDVDLDREWAEVSIIARAYGIQIDVVPDFIPTKDEPIDAKHRRLGWLFLQLARYHLKRTQPRAH